MSEMAAMWSQSMPWRNPNQNEAMRRPVPNPCSSSAEITTPPPDRLHARRSAVPRRYSTTFLQGTAISPSGFGGGSEPRVLPPPAEDLTERGHDLALAAAAAGA